MTEPNETNQNPYATSISSETASVLVDDRIGVRAATLARWQTFSAVVLIVIGLAIGLMFSLIFLSSGFLGGWREVLVIAGIYGGIAIFLFILPGVLLWLTAKRAKGIGFDPTHQKIGEMIGAQTRFWRYTSFALGLLMLLMALMFVGGFGFN